MGWPQVRLIFVGRCIQVTVDALGSKGLGAESDSSGSVDSTGVHQEKGDVPSGYLT